ncbi:hypothetical protein QGN29_07750 [Temperatibacter marinus]|uniref:Uncharacterized protein n=1 Tax=Temperatibacter marinus TaxID=1456591 RepID=A0AA52EG46_9PROT|nr:hypothetical protein [Temperatibacter marinus]WND01451.1 hypothetical protein QGN29_07750 [Temperatibacter marinus]
MHINKPYTLGSLSGVILLIALVLASFLNVLADERQTEGQQTEDRITVYGTAWGLTLSEDGTGLYNAIFNIVTRELDSTLDYSILPHKRAIATFSKDKESCIYPFSPNLVKSHYNQAPSNYLHGPTLNKVAAYFFSQYGEEPVNKFSDFSGKRIAVPIGSNMPKVWADRNITFISASDETSKARMLISKRVDYVSGTIPDIAIVFKQLGMQLPPYDASTPNVAASLTIVCKNTPNNQKFLDELNSHFHAHAKNELNLLFTVQGLPLLK